MKKILALLLLSFSVHAGVTLDWEINLLDKINIYEDASYDTGEVQFVYTLNNGDLFSYFRYEEEGLSEYKIVIVNKDNGDVKYSYQADMVDGLHFHNDGSFSYIDGSLNSYHIHFLNQNGNYEHTEISSFTGIWSGAPVLNQSSSDIIYARNVNNTLIIRKYTITSDNPTPTLSAQTSSGFNQDNYVINWDSSSGAQYQIQSSTDLTNWVDVGSALIGTGDMMTWANHVTNSQAFYRVVEE